jgi:UDP-N-acetylglucosamine 2-epimerase
VFPVHPITEKYLKQYGLWKKLCDDIKIIPPAGYLKMLKLMVHARKILTDSEDLKKEAYMLGVSCITMR